MGPHGLHMHMAMRNEPGLVALRIALEYRWDLSRVSNRNAPPRAVICNAIRKSAKLQCFDMRLRFSRMVLCGILGILAVLPESQSALAATSVAPASARVVPDTHAAAVEIDGLGKGTAPLDGPWAFHIGDHPQWAQPDVDDTPGQHGWESLRVNEPWGAQGHYSYSGFAWYRLRLHIKPAPGFNSQFQILLPKLSDACEVYWNGSLVGRYGSLPPHPSWPATYTPAVFTLGGSPQGTLAIRVWKGPLGSSSSGYIGGIAATPLVGDAQSIAGQLSDWNYDFVIATLYTNALNVLYFIIAIGAFVLWLRHPKDKLLLWFSIFTIGPAYWISVGTMRLPISQQWADFNLQPLWELRNAALWFLLIDLLHLRDRPRLVHWAKVFAIISLVTAFLDGCLAFAPNFGVTSSTITWADAVLTVFTEPCNLYLLVIVAVGFRHKLDPVRRVLAVSALLSQTIAVIVATAQQGQRFTHWTLAGHLYEPLFHLGPVYFTAQNILDLLLFFSILYVVYHYVREQQTRKTLLEQELESARELQEVLIPEKPPTLPGFTVSSAYHPALEVGGDFFQIIPLDAQMPGSTLIVLGDVSGKGLRAAMAVSMIVGAVRTLAETTTSPAEVLAGISRRLHGRLQGGFATCLALRIDPGGICVLASAGHPAPYLNEREIELPGALPLGIEPATVYDEVKLHIATGDRCSLYTDGLLEARSADGEIFSFERLQALFAAGSDAARATSAAIDFGQEDDITVLTLTRTANA